MTIATLIVTRIEPQDDRVLLYGARRDYHVIASGRESAALRVGDTIAYEPYEATFGWFVRRVEPPAAQPAREHGRRLRDDENQLHTWLSSFPPRWAVHPLPASEASPSAYREALFQVFLDELEILKELFGYEAVYFGIGCKAFPEAPSQEEA
jgi:hypothetical protein